MSEARREVHVPFAPVSRLCAPLREELTAAALAMNDRYLYEFVEGHAFCPFARGGREAGETSRYVHHAETTSIEPLVTRMLEIARDPRQVVAQVILPRIEVEPDAWIRFCDALTAEGHARRGGAAVLAFAALHPRLPYRDESALALIPLFRRAPDPTIQWVRLDSLAEIYAGRDTEVRFVDPADIVAYVRDAPPPRQPLYERIADTNARAAHAMGIASLETALASLAEEARATYERIVRAHDCARHPRDP